MGIQGGRTKQKGREGRTAGFIRKGAKEGQQSLTEEGKKSRKMKKKRREKARKRDAIESRGRHNSGIC